MSETKTATESEPRAKTEYVIEPGKQELTVTRVFDAPPALVFKAWTDPKLIAQWWGPSEYTMTVDTMDVRPGGSWRFIHSNAQGTHPFRGVYHDIVTPERIIGTFEYEPVAGHVSLVSARFEPVGGNQTRLVQHQVFESLEDRDGMVGSGMQRGSDESMDRLAELLERLKDKA